jgi:small-conductance mechanosensitive channel
MLFRTRERLRRPAAYFDSHTQQWHEVGLGEQIDTGRAARARGTLVVIALLLTGVLVVFSQRQTLFPGHGTEVRIATVVALVILGITFARALGRSLAPALFRRIEPGTAGTVGFLIRLLTVVAVVIVALRIAGLDAGTIAVGGAFTAVVLGLAAQQTLANMFAGLVLLTTRPFRVGERVRFHGGAVAGDIDGIVSSLGLFYTTLVKGADRVMVPNSILLQLAVIPMREPDPVELRVRLSADVTPNELQELLVRELTVDTRYPPHVELEELDDDQLGVVVRATPRNPSQGGRLAAEIVAAIRADRQQVALAR